MKAVSKSERTRQFIIESTAAIFNTKGYAGTSMSDLTEATKLTKGSIYGNFENKEAVALAAFDHNLSKVSAAIGSEMNKYVLYKEKLMVYVNVYGNFLEKSFPIGGCPILNTAVEADDTHPLLKKRAAAAIVSWKNKLAKIIETGIENKEFNTKIDPEKTALAIIAMVEGGIMITKVTGKLNYRKAIMQSVEKIINDLGRI